GPRPSPSPQRKEPTMRNGSNAPSHLRSSTPPPSTGPGRRAFVGGALAVAGLTATGCGPSDGLVSGNTRLREWNLFAGGDGLRLMEMHEEYRSNHPDVDISATTFGWGSPFYTKVAMGAAGGRGGRVAPAAPSRLE